MKRILLVEDNELNLDVLSRFLIHAGYEVVIAVDGLEAVELAQNTLPDLILMDLSLPKMDGWTATKIIKNEPATAHIPVIAITANATEDIRRETLRSGFEGFYAKPIRFQELTNHIQNLSESLND